jgi:uncharacterized membrane protein
MYTESLPVAIVKGILSYFNVRVTSSTLREYMHYHPDFPSMLSISDALKYFGIETFVTKLEKTKLLEVDAPFVAHTNDIKNPLKFVIKKDAEEIEWFEQGGKTHKQLTLHFMKEWTGVAMFLDLKEGHEEDEYPKRRRIEILKSYRLPVALLVVVITISSIGISKINVFTDSSFLFLFKTMLITKSLGVVFTVLLLWHEVDNSNYFLQALCSLNTKKATNCSAVLNSKGAKVFNKISWSEIGFYYFAGGLIYLMINPFGNSQSFYMLCTLNVIASFFIFFSLYYQWRIIKQWCVLCLGVQFLLLIELFATFLLTPGNIFLRSLMYNYLNIYLLLSFTWPIILWQSLRFLVLKARQYDYLKKKIIRIKMNRKVFFALSENSNNYDFMRIEKLGIDYGNPNATNNLLMVCSPFCSACGSAQKQLELLLKKMKDIKVKLVFVMHDDESSLMSIPVKHLISISRKGKSTLTVKALRDWYSNKWNNYTGFSEHYPVSESLDNYNLEVKFMNEWAKNNGISYTPTYFLNGCRLPVEYDIQDLHYLLYNLSDN